MARRTFYSFHYKPDNWRVSQVRNMGVVGIYVHNLLNSKGEKADKGANPFSSLTFQNSKKKLSSIVKAHNPPYQSSKNVYDHIEKNLADWVEEAIRIGTMLDRSTHV